MLMLQCKACDHVFEDNVGFCPRCGVDIISAKHIDVALPAPGTAEESAPGSVPLRRRRLNLILAGVGIVVAVSGYIWHRGPRPSAVTSDVRSPGTATPAPVSPSSDATNEGRGPVASRLDPKSPPLTQFITFNSFGTTAKLNRSYVWLHGNETTARRALEEHIRAHGGQAFLINSSGRFAFVLAGHVDPNRIFSIEGAEKNLRLLNPSWSPSELQTATQAIEKDSSAILKTIVPQQGGLLVSVHSNSSPDPLRQELVISNSSSLNDGGNRTDYFLVTNEADFSVLSTSPFNVVLQNRPTGAEDGSLSRLASRMNFRYANVECANGRVAKQRQMLEWLDENLR